MAPIRSRLAAICGLLVPVVFTFGWLVGGFAQPASFDWTRHDISDLGAMTADQPWLYNQIGANLSGILLFVFAVGLWREVVSAPMARVGVGLLAIAGIGQFLDGFLRLDCRAIDPGCAQEPVSWHAVAHVVESLVTLFALAVAPFVLARTLNGMPAWADLLRPTFLFGIAAIAALVGLTILAPGIGPRAAATIWFVWVCVLAYRMLRLKTRSGPINKPPS
jgi:hypothetical protein